MSKTIDRFIKLSQVCLALGAAPGAPFPVDPQPFNVKHACAHLNLPRVMSMLASSLACHILARLQGSVLHTERLAGVRVWRANGGRPGLLILDAVNGYWNPRRVNVLPSLPGDAAASIYPSVANPLLTFRQPAPTRWGPPVQQMAVGSCVPHAY